MRIWSLNPRYLDRAGLLAAWRESLLAKKVLEGRAKGYKNHPQLRRFRDEKEPLEMIKHYLQGLFEEALVRGYKFEADKIGVLKKNKKTITVNSGQIKYEFEHLLNKLAHRDPQRFKDLKKEREISAHKLFKVVEGAIADWEKTK